MKLTKKELQDLKNTGTCEVIRLQKITKKAIKDNDLCNDYLRNNNRYFDNYVQKKPLKANGVIIIVTAIEVIKVSANDIHVPKDFYKDLFDAKDVFPNLNEKEILANPDCYKLTLTTPLF
jgi:hypothetical protein